MFEVLVDIFLAEVLGLKFAVLSFLVFKVGEEFFAFSTESLVDLLEGFVRFHELLFLLADLAEGG